MRSPSHSRFDVLTPAERAATRTFVEEVDRQIPADLLQASLFGSRARDSSRPDSDIDILLVFRRLPPDREPHATHAEDIAADVAAWSALPITTWAISLADLRIGNRTPMLVDALEDSIPLWCAGPALPALPFTPWDASWCVSALLERLEEGRCAVLSHLARGDLWCAAKRMRDDLVRGCTAVLLAHGITRPRRADAVAAYRRVTTRPIGFAESSLFDWVRASYGRDGRDEDSLHAPPPCDAPSLWAVIGAIAGEAAHLLASLPRR